MNDASDPFAAIDWHELIPLFPPLTDDAAALGRYVVAHPYDQVARMAYIDALNECGNNFIASQNLMELGLQQYMRQVIESLGVPARLLNSVREEEK